MKQEYIVCRKFCPLALTIQRFIYAGRNQARCPWRTCCKLPVAWAVVPPVRATTPARRPGLQTRPRDLVHAAVSEGASRHSRLRQLTSVQTNAAAAGETPSALQWLTQPLVPLPSCGRLISPRKKARGPVGSPVVRKTAGSPPACLLLNLESGSRQSPSVCTVTIRRQPAPTAGHMPSSTHCITHTNTQNLRLRSTLHGSTPEGKHIDCITHSTDATVPAVTGIGLVLDRMACVRIDAWRKYAVSCVGVLSFSV